MSQPRGRSGFVLTQLTNFVHTCPHLEQRV